VYLPVARLVNIEGVKCVRACECNDRRIEPAIASRSQIQVGRAAVPAIRT
jgi:hypothetical protein